MYGHNEDERRAARKSAREHLGPQYSRRLAAAYATLLDAQPLLQSYAPLGPGGFHRPLNEVCEAIRRLRDAGDLDF